MSATAIDNDILIKACCFGLVDALVKSREIVILGAAPYVVRSRLERASLADNNDLKSTQFDDLMARCEPLEPTQDELALAASIEARAQELDLPLDVGESQLTAVALRRSLEMVETGDKRAVRALGELSMHMPELAGLAGKVRCLEQIVLGCDLGLDELSKSICTEPDVDKTLSICFQCHLAEGDRSEDAAEGLRSYINGLRRDVGELLCQ